MHHLINYPNDLLFLVLLCPLFNENNKMNQSILIYTLPFLLSMDIFFLSISGGVTMQPYRWGMTLKNSLIFSVFQAFAGLIAFYLAQLISPLVSDYSALAGSMFTAYIGLKMMSEAIKVKNEQRTFLIEDIQILWPLALASSINAFTLFFGLGFFKIPLQASLITLFVSIFIISQVGQFIGSHYRPIRIGRSSKFAGGLFILVIIIINYIL